MRSPILGELSLASGIHPGLLLREGSTVFTVRNPRFGNLESFSQSNYLRNSIDSVKHELQQYITLRRLYAANYERMKALIAQGGVSKQDFESAKNSLDTTNAAITRKNEQLRHLQERFIITNRQLKLQKEAIVKTADASVVWAVLKKNSECLNVNDEVVQLLRQDDVWVEAFFSERYASKIRSGMQVVVREFGSKRKWTGSVVFVRFGVGRIAYSAPVTIPPQKLKERLIAVRIKVDWESLFTPEEFYGVGRSVEVAVCR
jgi:multidrug resistance efflux pump